MPKEVQEIHRRQRRYAALPIQDIFPDHLFPPDVPQSHFTTKQARDLVGKMLVIDPNERISVDDALNHPYFSLWHDDAHLNGVSVVLLKSLFFCFLNDWLKYTQVPLKNYEKFVEESNEIEQTIREEDEWKMLIFKKGNLNRIFLFD